MKIKVFRPVDGRTRVVVDDRRGATGLYQVLADVPVKGLAGALKGPLEAWKSRRDTIVATRRRR